MTYLCECVIVLDGSRASMTYLCVGVTVLAGSRASLTYPDVSIHWPRWQSGKYDLLVCKCNFPGCLYGKYDLSKV